jgi:hypothetical protein
MKNGILVTQISQAEAEPWLLNRHYAKRLCPITHAFGAWDGKNLIGVVTYGTPVSSTLKTGICGEFWANFVLELNRLCCESTANLASILVSRSLKALPKPSIVVSYADINQGHVGYVYQATNFIYTGLSASFKDPMVKGYEHKHHTSIGDEARGHKSRVGFLREKYGEENVYFIERSRKHRYVQFCGTVKQKRAMQKDLKYKVLPYPKGDVKRYDASALISTQMRLI